MPAVVTGKPPELGGSVARREATGRGLMSLLPAAASHVGIPIRDARVVIHGFGNVARYAAVAASEMGCRVIAVSDYTGAIHREDGTPGLERTFRVGALPAGDALALDLELGTGAILRVVVLDRRDEKLRATISVVDWSRIR